MDTALIVMGVAVPGGAPVFCYAQLRSVIAAGDYGPLTLPRSAAPANHRRVAVMKALEVVSWRRRLSDDELAAFRSGLSAGAVSLPDDCPIEPGKTITGETFPDTYILETSDYVPVAGAGVLTSRGLCSADAVPDIVNLLIAAFGRAEVGEGVQALLTAIDDEIGSPNLVAETRRLGVVEDLRRSSSATAADLLRVAVVKVDARSDDACLQLRIIREPVVTARRDLRVVVRMKTSTFEVVRRLILIPADTDERIVDSPSHIVEAELQVFDARDGEFLQLVDTWFTQGFLLSMTMMGATDLLPTPFSSAPHSPDLIARPRFEDGGPKTRLGFGNRSGGFDVLKATADIVDQLAGKRDEKLESRFFEAGHQSQVEVIRWIKSQLENTDVEEAFLLDPYLGRPAMERVILRNGSESLKLTLMVSPGAVDPDAEKMDAIVGSGLHVQGLVAAAEALKSQLCGEVEIVHVERGSDQCQAFHDRYLGLRLQDGTPRVFVLSNSLSKAAGAWPFAIAEVDRRAAWRIAAYVSALRRGLENGHPVTSTVIWRSGPRESQYEVPEATAFHSALWSFTARCAKSAPGQTMSIPNPRRLLSTNCSPACLKIRMSRISGRRSSRGCTGVIVRRACWLAGSKTGLAMKRWGGPLRQHNLTRFSSKWPPRKDASVGSTFRSTPWSSPAFNCRAPPRGQMSYGIA
nr:VPA1262 family N-terminal domain-containing protein [Brevundimonas naejangsanensis]